MLNPDSELLDFVKSSQFMHDSLDRRLIVYGQESDHIFEKMADYYCVENCIRRMATLEDVFLRLTGRDLRE